MFVDGIVSCDLCGKPIRVVHKGELLPGHKTVYCAACIAKLPRRPKWKKILMLFVHWRW